MATIHASVRPELAAFRESMSLSFPELVERLTAAIGKKLTAYIGSVKDVRAIDRWIAGNDPYGDVEVRLRLAYRVVKMLSDYSESNRIVQAWLTGLNPELNDRVPLRLLREGDPEVVGPEVLAAARAFVAGE